MKKPSRLIIAIACSGALLFAGFILAVNLYVQSAGMQSRISEELTDAVGLPVSFFRTTFSPWGGFRLDEIKIAAPAGTQDFLRADCLEVRCQILPLLSGRAILKRIVLHSPVLVLRENEQHQFEIPGIRKLAKPSSKSDTEKVLNFPEAIRSPSALSPVPAHRPAPTQPKFDIKKILLRDGTIRFIDLDGNLLCRLAGVRCSLEATAPLQTFKGKLQIGKITLLESWEINGLKSAISLLGANLHLEKLEAEMGGGRLEGAFDGDFSGTNIPYNFRFELKKAELTSLLPPDFPFAEQLSGQVGARLELAGLTGKKRNNLGHAELRIANTKVDRLRLLDTVGSIAKVELKDLLVAKFEVSGDIINSEIHLQPSTISSPHLEIGFAGKINSLQQLDLRAQMILDESLFKKLPTETRDNFVKTSTGSRTLDFSINGPVSSPQSNLQDRLLGDRVPKAVRRFLGSKTNPTPSDDATPPKKNP